MKLRKKQSRDLVLKFLNLLKMQPQTNRIDVTNSMVEEGWIVSTEAEISEKEIECSTLYSLRSEVAIPLTVVIAIVCFSGNSLVIFIFSRSKKNC